MASYEKRPSGLWSVRFKTMTPDGVETYKRLSGYKTKKEDTAGVLSFLWGEIT